MPEENGQDQPGPRSQKKVPTEQPEAWECPPGYAQALGEKCYTYTNGATRSSRVQKLNVQAWNPAGTQLDPSWNPAGTQLEPSWNQLEPRWNPAATQLETAGTQLEPSWNPNGTQLEPFLKAQNVS